MNKSIYNTTDYNDRISTYLKICRVQFAARSFLVSASDMTHPWHRVWHTHGTVLDGVGRGREGKRVHIKRMSSNIIMK